MFKGESYDLELLEAPGEPLHTVRYLSVRATILHWGRSYLEVTEPVPRGLRLTPDVLFFSEVACCT